MTELNARPRWVRRLVPATTGLLAASALPPLDLGPIIFVAPVPLLMAWRSRGADVRGAAADGFVAGVAYFAFVVSWTWYFGAVAYFPFVAVLAAYWALTGALVALAQRGGVRRPLVIAAAWTLVEALRGRWPFGGFSWGEFGYALHDVPVARSVAGWGGVLAVSFLVVVSAAYIEEFLDRRGRGVATRSVGLGLVGVVVIAIGAHVALPDLKPGATIRVAIVQGNDKNRTLTSAELAERFLPVSHFTLARGLDDPVDLIVLPESSLDEDPRIDEFLLDEITSIARTHDAAVLANAAVEIDDGRRLENTNFYFDPDGELVGTYVKQHLVPYGEYVPGRRFLEGLVKELEQIPRDQAPGDRREIFRVGGVPFANLICFESAFTEISRAYADEGAEVLVVSTNNRSFRRSPNSAQHLALGQMRVAETGRPLVQAAISGRSAFIDADGDVVATTQLFDRTTLVRSVTGTRGRTPYVALGDWILVVGAAILVVAAVRARRVMRFAASGTHS